MDEMKLKFGTNFMRGILAKILAKALAKSLGCKIDILINSIELTHNDGNVNIHADIDAETTSSEIMKLVKKFGLD